LCGIPQADSPAASFAPHVQIHWGRREVEIDARVVLRDGPLELLACTPGTREHESILVTPARPLHIFQALGLLGAEPGAPPAWDPARQVAVPGRGSPLAVDIRYEQDGVQHRRGAHEWLKDSSRGQPIGPLQWVFSGSVQAADGGLGADHDGTVLCLVDFDTALIGLNEAHSSDNALLWVEPDTPRVPAVGTPCILIIRPVPAAAGHRITLGRYGVIRYDDRLVSLEQLRSELSAAASREEFFEVQMDPWALECDRQNLLAAVAAVGRRASVQDQEESRAPDGRRPFKEVGRLLNSGCRRLADWVWAMPGPAAAEHISRWAEYARQVVAQARGWLAKRDGQHHEHIETEARFPR
jgi:hypothetical protein